MYMYTYSIIHIQIYCIYMYIVNVRVYTVNSHTCIYIIHVCMTSLYRCWVLTIWSCINSDKAQVETDMAIAMEFLNDGQGSYM